MSRAVDALQALGFIVLIGVAGAIGANDVEPSTTQQMAHLCSATGWPADAKIAFERACKGELRRKST